MLRILASVFGSVLLFLSLPGFGEAQGTFAPRTNAEQRAFEAFTRSLERGEEDRALRNGQRDCNRGNLYMCAVMGVHVLEGDPDQDDLRTALAVLPASCEGDTGPIAANSCNTVARILADTSLEGFNDFARAQPFAERGCAMDGGYVAGEACYLAGKLVSDAESGLEQDLVKAAQFFNRGCQLEEGLSCIERFNIAYFNATQARPDQEASTLAAVAATADSLFLTCEAIQQGCGLAAEGARVGLFGPADSSRVTELGRIGCDAGDLLACEQLGAALDNSEGQQVLNQACDAGSPTACLRLAYTHLSVTNRNGGRMNFVRRGRDEDALNAATRACELGAGEGCFWQATLSPRSANSLRVLETGCRTHSAFSACFGLAIEQIVQAFTLEEISAGVDRLDGLCPLGLSFAQGCSDIYEETRSQSGPLAEESAVSEALYLEALEAHPGMVEIFVTTILPRPESDGEGREMMAQVLSTLRDTCLSFEAYLRDCYLVVMLPEDDVLATLDEQSANFQVLIDYLVALRTRCADGNDIEACAFFDYIFATTAQFGDVPEGYSGMMDRLSWSATGAIQNLAATCLAEEDGRTCAAVARSQVLLQSYDGEETMLLSMSDTKRVVQLACSYGDLFACQFLLDITSKGAHAFGEELDLAGLPPNPVQALEVALRSCRMGLDLCDY